MELCSIIIRILSLLCFYVVNCDLEVVNYPTLVDKSLMIRHVFDGPKYKLITAPTRFGKSTNLDMLRAFLSVPTDSRGVRDYKIELLRRDTFKDLKIYKDYRAVFEQHFAQYPVINITFGTSELVGSKERVVDVIKERIHWSFMEHNYLCTSQNIADGFLCALWNDETKYRNFDEDDVARGLYLLAENLYNHYKQKVFILIDDYDDMVSRAIFNLYENSLKSIISFIRDVLREVTKANSFIDGVVVTGISVVTALDESGSNVFEHYGFLDEHAYAEFYGFLQPEVNGLFRKFNVSDEMATGARNLYDGYVCKNGRRLYSPYSILKCVKKGMIKNYWRKSGRDGLEDIFRYSPIKKCFRKMLGGECLDVELIKDAVLLDGLKLRKLLGNAGSTSGQDLLPLLFTVLFERGYFSFGGEKKSCLRIPNVEIEREFITRFSKYYTVAYRLDERQMQRCASFYNKMLANQKSEAIKAEMIIFHSSLKELFNTFAITNGETVSNATVLEHVIFTVASYASGFIQKSRFRYGCNLLNGTAKKCRLDLYMHKGSFAMIMELKHRGNGDPDSTAALEQILCRRYYNVFEDRKYTRQKIKLFLLVGLSKNNKGNVSVSCMLNTKDVRQAVTVSG